MPYTGNPRLRSIADEFMSGHTTALEFLNRVAAVHALAVSSLAAGGDPSGDAPLNFSIVVGDGSTVAFYCSSVASPPSKLFPGVHVLSNGHLNAAWPKCEWLRGRFALRTLDFVRSSFESKEREDTARVAPSAQHPSMVRCRATASPFCVTLLALCIVYAHLCSDGVSSRLARCFASQTPSVVRHVAHRARARVVGTGVPGAGGELRDVRLPAEANVRPLCAAVQRAVPHPAAATMPRHRQLGVHAADVRGRLGTALAAARVSCRGRCDPCGVLLLIVVLRVRVCPCVCARACICACVCVAYPCTCGSCMSAPWLGVL
jgi:hypothetical protein